MTKIDDYLVIHRLLWTNGKWREHATLPSGTTITVYRTVAPGKKFATAEYGDLRFVSQNLRKASPNTVRCEQGWRITWVFRRGYVGEITQNPDGHIIMKRLPSADLPFYPDDEILYEGEVCVRQ